MSDAVHRKLKVWHKSMDLVEEVYRLTRILPKDELYCLVYQLRRAVVSIPSNIAEGNARNSHKEYVHFLSIARGSKSEVETQLEICVRLKYLDSEQVKVALGLCDEVGRMLSVLMKKLLPSP
jgi:four helix bundle protein